MKGRFTTIVLATVLAGCAGTATYRGPGAVQQPRSSKEIAKSRDQVWAGLVPALGREFFVINNMDKASGFVNVSYSGDPEKYIDCGVVESHGSGLDYSFPGARADVQYQMIAPPMVLLRVQRHMELDGRINLVLEEVSPNLTRVSVTARYVVKRDQVVRDVNGRMGSFSNSVSFNGGQDGRFPPDSSGRALTCIATGALESQILDLIN